MSHMLRIPQHYLPSKKLITSSVIALSIIGIFVVLSLKKPGTQKSFSVSVNSAELAPISEADQDNDGLKDWEEALWGTNPAHPDSDGDGTNDAEEVGANRNPMLAGPNDILLKPSSGSTASTDGQPFSYTDEFARQVFAQYFSLSQSGGFNNEKAVLASTDAFVKKTLSEEMPDVYDKNDITIIPETKEGLRVYGNAVGLIAQKYSAASTGTNELIILKNALTSQDESDMEGLSLMITYYEKGAGDILAIPVPVGLAGAHLDGINALMRVAQALKTIQNVLEDPMAGVVGMAQYKKSLLDVAVSGESITKYFSRKGIPFKKNEPGYIFTPSYVREAENSFR